MGNVQIIGVALSTCVRAVRIVAEEKGVKYDLSPVMPHLPDVDVIHPLGKIPVMRHGDVALCESRAIALYLDRAFDGPSLSSNDPVRGAEIEQWVSMITSSFDQVLVREYLRPYFFPSTLDGKPDRASIDIAIPKMEKQLAVLERAVSRNGFLAGDSFTLADAFLAPILLYLKEMPESGAIIAKSPGLTAYLVQISARPSIAATTPPSR